MIVRSVANWFRTGIGSERSSAPHAGALRLVGGRRGHVAHVDYVAVGDQLIDRCALLEMRLEAFVDGARNVWDQVADKI